MSFLFPTYSWTDINGLNTIANLLLVLVRDSVGDNDFLELATVQGFNGIAAQDAVRDNSNGILCATLLDKNTRSLDESAASIGHVIDENGGFTGDFSD